MFIVMGMIRVAGIPDTYAKKTSPIKQLIQQLELGDPVFYGTLTIIPVYKTGRFSGSSVLTLEEALKNNWIKITELEGGRVPEVRITNRSKHKIFLMGGEILTGCKQDRILAGDVLLGPYTKNLKVPVYCVEHGRWNTVSEAFYSKDNLGTYYLRAQAQTKTPSAQSGIWAKIASENEKMGVSTATNAYQAAYDNIENKAKIRKIAEKMQQVPHLYEDTVGVVIGLGGRIVSADVFSDPNLFQRQWPKILKSSALSSIAVKQQKIISQKEAADFFRYLMNKDFATQPSLDLGTELSLTNSRVNVNALEYQTVVLHLAGFPREAMGTKDRPEQDREQRVRVIRENQVD